jgi:hypothetical protein
MPPAAGALDLPGAPAQVKLKRTPKDKTFQVVFKRPSFFPAVGSADDPAVGTPGGMLIEVFSASEGYAAVNAPRGAGTPDGRRIRPRTRRATTSTTLPCCAPAVCAGGVGYHTCCLEAGQSCSGSFCCPGLSCIAGTCG